MKSNPGQNSRFSQPLQPRYAPPPGIMLDIHLCLFIIHSPASGGP